MSCLPSDLWKLTSPRKDLMSLRCHWMYIQMLVDVKKPQYPVDHLKNDVLNDACCSLTPGLGQN